MSKLHGGAAGLVAFVVMPEEALADDCDAGCHALCLLRATDVTAARRDRCSP